MAEITSNSLPNTSPIVQRSPIWRRYQEFRLIGQDPVLALGLILVGDFVLLFVAYPLLRVIW